MGNGKSIIINNAANLSPADNRADAGIAPHSAHPKVFSRYVIFSVVLFLITLIGGGTAFFFSMRQLIQRNKVSELTRMLKFEQMEIEISVKSKIAIIIKMAESPLIKSYLSNPVDTVAAGKALIEIPTYRKALGGSIFWVNDIDKLFYFDDKEPYVLDPANPENYWYDMTLYGTETYNFNINYNPALNLTNLWVNAPVFSSAGKPLGMVGTGIDISEFIANVYKGDWGKIAHYFFKNQGEITGAEDINLVIAKTPIADVLHGFGVNISLNLDSLAPNEIRTISTLPAEIAVSAIPTLGWYAIAICPNTIDDFKTPLTAFFFLVILIIAFILILTNIFILRLLVPLRKTMESLEKATMDAEKSNEEILEGILYASTIQKGLLPDESDFKKAFTDYSIIWEPRDIVGGDIYWIKNFDDGTLLCVCDCTGHGVPGALLTILLTSALESIATQNRCNDTAAIVWELDRRLAVTFGRNESNNSLEIRNGCDLAIIFIAKDGAISLSAGHTNLFVCNGEAVQRYRGQKIFVGEGKLKSANDVKTVHIPHHPNNKYYVASDGLFDQPDGAGTARPFGYKAFENLILLHHNERLSAVSDKVWSAFWKHCGGEERIDDFELITFKP